MALCVLAHLTTDPVAAVLAGSREVVVVVVVVGGGSMKIGKRITDSKLKVEHKMWVVPT